MLQALNDTWMEREPGDSSRSNYFYFPQGTYQFVSRATAAPDPSENANWTLSVKWQMSGVVIDLDHVSSSCFHSYLLASLSPSDA